MSDLHKILKEEYEKKVSITPNLLIEMIEEAMGKLSPLKEEEMGSSPSAERRSRAIWLPIQFPTEISVGQKPGSKDRDMFHAWMSNLPEGDLGTKVQAIEAYINNPPQASVADTLSYLMFLNTFSFMLQEFNASVAGFLWEPFLAAMFGAQSVQVPTSEGDIADVKLMIQRGGILQRVSLKILTGRPGAGNVGGSFTDLVDHFSEHPSEPMIYVVIKKYEGDTLMKFYEFPISQDTFFEFIGHPTTVIARRTEEKPFQVPGPISPRQQIIAMDKSAKEEGTVWRVDQITAAGSEEPLGGNTRLQPGVEYIAHLSHSEKVAGQAGKDKLSANARHLWGEEEDYSQWYGLYQQLQQGGIAPGDFWAAVKGARPELTPWAPEGALGYREREQFKIGWGYAEKHAQVDELGALDISKEALDKAFAAGSQSIGGSLTDLFNSMGTLVENVSKFFLIDCGASSESDARKCDVEDASRRSESGQKAIADANTIQKVVELKIATQVEK